MNPSRLFIERPVATLMLVLAMALFGARPQVDDHGLAVGQRSEVGRFAGQQRHLHFRQRRLIHQAQTA
ncbi:MAG: hypothetical protein M1449_07995, partial [Candidatus Thermoplasmatota archaeon]|nr:hypothetical protein [Candidatus Thermoplasmatota archaeon]